MAEKLLKEQLYGDLLSPNPGYATDFALGMTYSLGFDAMLTAYLAFGMLGEVDDNVVQSPHILLEAITKSSEKVVVFCNKGGIAVPPTIRKVFSLMEHSIFEVFDKNNHKANFHPKLWLIREINNDDKRDIILKLIVTSRNMAFADTIDCVACLTGKVGAASVKNEKHKPLELFIKEVVKASNIKDEQEKSVLKLAADLMRVERFDVDEPFVDYDFFPYLFNKNFGLPNVKDYLVGRESVIVSPFIDPRMIDILNPQNKQSRAIVTRKEFVDDKIFRKFSDKGGVYVALDELASRGMDLHAKMYFVFKDRDNQYLYLGSANATKSAFERNGEFLLGLKYKHGNTRFFQFLSEFYENGNSESKFILLNEPLQNSSPIIRWDEAESALKKLMCADNLKACITHHRDDSYSVLVSSCMSIETSEFAGNLFIAPLQRKELQQKWTGRVEFNGMKPEELSEFYILSATSSDGKIYESVVKIETDGMPSARDKEIFKSIIKTRKDFYKFLELMLTDTPIQYISSELLACEHENQHSVADDGILYPNLYEKMLRIAATNPAQIRQIGQLVNKLGDDVIPDSFKKVYKQFVSALNKETKK